MGQDQLFRILKALSLQHPLIGYKQGMNFVVGFLLMLSGGAELEVFESAGAMLYNLFLVGFFEDDYPML